MIQRRISLSPDPAAPVNSGDPLKTMAKRLPPSSGRFIFEIMCWRKRKLPSLIRGQPGAEAAAEAELGVLGLDLVLHLLPLDPERRIGEQVVEAPVGMAVLGEGVAVDDPGGVLALQHHVGAADGVGLGVELLAEHLQAGLWVELAEVVLGHAEHAPRAAGGVVERLDDAWLGQQRVVLDEQQADHELDHLTGREVLAGRLVGQLGEAADQLLVEVAHLQVGDGVGVQVDFAELGEDLVEQVGPVEAADLGGEVELLEHVPGPGGEAGHVGKEVVGDVARVVEDLGQGQLGRVEELLARCADQDRVQVLGPSGVPGWDSSTLALVGSRTQSSRRRTVRGRMTLPYSTACSPLAAGRPPTR